MKIFFTQSQSQPLTQFAKRIVLNAMFGLATMSVNLSAVAQSQISTTAPDWDERSVFAFITSELLAQDAANGDAAEVLYTEAVRLGHPDLLKRVVQWAAQSNKTAMALNAAYVWEKTVPTDAAAAQAVDFFLVSLQRYSELTTRIGLRPAPFTQVQAAQYLRLAERTVPAGAGPSVYKALVEGLTAQAADANTQWLLAQVAAKANLKPQSMEHVKRAADAKPPVLDAVFVLLREEPELALGALRRWTQDDVKSAEPWRALGLALSQLKRPVQAAQAFEAGIKLAPKDVLLHLERMDQLRAAKQAGEARKSLMAAYAQKSNISDARTALLLAEQLEEDYHPVQALEIYALALKLAEGQPQVQDAIVERQHQLKARRGDEASLTALEGKLQSAKNDKEAARLRYIVAGILRDTHKSEQALALLQALPASPERDYEMSLCYDAAGKSVESEALLRGALKAQPSASFLLNALGYGLVDRNASPSSVAEGKALLEKAYAVAPDSSAIIDSLGWAYFRVGDFTKALPLLEEAYILKRDPEVAAHLGELLFKMGQSDRARSVFKEGHAIDAKHKVLVETMKRLKISW